MAATGVAAAFALLAPSLAEACNVCAKHQETNTSVYVVLAAFILVPYVVVSVALRVIRQIERLDGNGEKS